MTLSPIEQTKNWVSRVIVGYNFCPFAKKEVVNNPQIIERIEQLPKF